MRKAAAQKYTESVSFKLAASRAEDEGSGAFCGVQVDGGLIVREWRALRCIRGFIG